MISSQILSKLLIRCRNTLVAWLIYTLAFAPVAFSNESDRLASLPLKEPKAAAPNYHLVGWVNTVVPGGGQFMLGHYFYGGVQAAIEVSTFAYGYTRAGRNSFMIDGSPTEIAGHSGSSQIVTQKQNVCVKYTSNHRRCLQYSTKTSNNSVDNTDNSQHNLTVPLFGDILQEIGLKYHMVNVFESYREAARLNGVTENIDQTSTKDLFLAPFNPDVVFNPWVVYPLIISAAAVAYNYSQSINQYNTPRQPLDRESNLLYAFNYGFIYPFGSGVPEEMFYRGFLQSEFLSMVPSVYFATPLTTLAYTFSHTDAGKPSAALTGVYLSLITYKDHGALSKAVAYHFWADIFAGIAEYYILRNAESLPATQIANFQFQF